MHHGALHVGKSPASMADGNNDNRKVAELMALQKELEELVQREEYEKAAIVRDKINQIKQELHK